MKISDLSNSQIIDALGGTGALAAELGISAPAVAQWRTRKISRRFQLLIKTDPKFEKRILAWVKWQNEANK